MKRFIAIALGAFLALAVNATHALTYTPAGGAIIDRIGVNNITGAANQNRAYFMTTTAPTVCTLWMIDITSTTGRAVYSALVVGKVMGKTISRIDYTPIANNYCTVDLIEVSG